MVFVCQNNQYGEHTKFADTQKTASVVDRAPAYAMKGIKVDGMDPAATYQAARRGRRPRPQRPGPRAARVRHVPDARPRAQRQERVHGPRECWPPQVAADPVPRFRQWLLDNGHADEATLAGIEARVQAEIDDAYERPRPIRPPTRRP